MDFVVRIKFERASKPACELEAGPEVKAKNF